MPKEHAKDPETHLTEDEQKRVGALLKDASLEVVARRFQIAPATLRTIAAGLEGRRGTLRMVRDGLKEES